MLRKRGERRKVEREENATLRIVTFVVDQGHFGVEISSVREIDRMHKITRVPQALSFVEGVVHLRGAIIPVIDLSRRFGGASIVPDRLTRIIIASLQGHLVGLIVNAVNEVVAIPAGSIGPPPPMTFEASARFVSGMTKVGDVLLSLLSLEKLLSTDEVAQLSSL